MCQTARVVTDASALQQEHEQLRGALRARQSPTHFAHGAVATFLTLTFLAAATRLLWRRDTEHTWFQELSVALAVIAAIYAVLRFTLGKRALKEELTQFERLKQVRQALRIDDPGALLP